MVGGEVSGFCVGCGKAGGAGLGLCVPFLFRKRGLNGKGAAGGGKVGCQ